jgi:hypothetical protein
VRIFRFLGFFTIPQSAGGLDRMESDFPCLVDDSLMFPGGPVFEWYRSPRILETSRRELSKNNPNWTGIVGHPMV